MQTMDVQHLTEKWNHCEGGGSCAAQPSSPYLHNGRVNSLDEVCRLMASTQLDIDLTDQQAADLVFFMTALEGDFPDISFPRLPSRSGESVMLRADSSGSHSTINE